MHVGLPSCVCIGWTCPCYCSFFQNCYICALTGMQIQNKLSGVACVSWLHYRNLGEIKHICDLLWQNGTSCKASTVQELESIWPMPFRCIQPTGQSIDLYDLSLTMNTLIYTKYKISPLLLATCSLFCQNRSHFCTKDWNLHFNMEINIS